jgi:hypothetical protein
MNSKVLVFGTDEVLLETRRILLESAGFETRTALKFSGAEQILKEREVALLVVCSSIEKRDVPQVLKAASFAGVKTR